MAYMRSSCEVIRTAGFSKAVKQTAWVIGLDLDIDIDKGWIFETVRFKVSGDDDKVRRFAKWYQDSINEYNNS